jgi:hypothetical protein
MPLAAEGNALLRIFMAGAVLLLWNFVRTGEARGLQNSELAIRSASGSSDESCGDHAIITPNFKPAKLLSDVNLVKAPGCPDTLSLSSTEDVTDSYNSIAAHDVFLGVNLAGQHMTGTQNSTCTQARR